ncbi:hypothetical protein [Streptomyces sp. NPDC017949]|uniref:hypothetical protein n=1 Tax=Streptomyces sp. NPDC017949 TaxID=3365020 RepID=UPI00378F1CFA
MTLTTDLHLRITPAAPRTRGDDPSEKMTAPGALICHPRTRRDDPGLSLPLAEVEDCSPHPRG